jgi:hypothetical protein
MSQAEYEQTLQRNRDEQARLEEERRIAAEQREQDRISQEEIRLQEQKQEEIRLEDELDKAEEQVIRELEAQQSQRANDGLTIDFFGSLMKGISGNRTSNTR